MNNRLTKPLLIVLFFVLLAILTFRCVWDSNMVFSASDLNIGRLAFKKNHLPAILTGYYTANQVLGNSGWSFTLFNLILSLLPLKLFANSFYALVLLLGSTSMVWFLRIWNRSWMASIIGALVAFWFNSIMLAPAGHAQKLEVLAFSVLSLCFIEKAIRSLTLRKTIGHALLAGISVGIMMIEQQDVALLAGLFLGAYTFFRLIQLHRKEFKRWLALLLPLGVVALLLSGTTVLRSYQQNISGAAAVHSEGNEKWNFITQWSMVPSEWPDLIAPGWGGWRTNDPEAPYWGKLGQSADWETTHQGFRNFRLTSSYLGIIPFLLALFAIATSLRNPKEEENTQILFWAIAGLIAFLLSFGKYSVLYKLFYHLPMMGNIRAPIKLLDNFQICLAILSAFAWDRVFAQSSEKTEAKSLRVFWIASSLIGGLFLLAGLRLMLAPGSQIATFTAMGFGRVAKQMTELMGTAWFHAALMILLFSALLFWGYKSKVGQKWAAPILILLLSADSLLLTSHYFKATDISSLEKGNIVVDYIKKHQNNERTFFIDQQGIYNQWLASDGPYHGLNLFNIWQMPRMPMAYKNFLGTVGRNPIRMWELTSIKYVATPANIFEQLKNDPVNGNLFKPALNYQVPTARGMRPDVLLEFKGTIPRFALFHAWETVPLEDQCKRLASKTHDAHSTVLLDPASNLGNRAKKEPFQPLNANITQKRATIKVQTDSEAIVRFSQRYQPDWRVFVDGKPAHLLRVDYLCLGVKIPPGNHEVEFRCVNKTGNLIFISTVFFGSLLFSILLLWSPKKSAVA